MTKKQKITTGIVLTLTIGMGLHEVHKANEALVRLHTLQADSMQLSEQVRQLQAAYNRTTNTLALLNESVTNQARRDAEMSHLMQQSRDLQKELAMIHETNGSANLTNNISLAWLERVKLLKERFAQWPGKPCPELQLLSDMDWLNEAAKQALDKDRACRQAMGHLRTAAKEKFAILMRDALNHYTSDNDGRLPENVSQLKPYLAPPGDVILDGYEIAKPGWVHPPQPNSPESKNAETWALVMKGAFTPDGKGLSDGNYLSDPEYDMNLVLFKGGHYMSGQVSRTESPLRQGPN